MLGIERSAREARAEFSLSLSLSLSLSSIYIYTGIYIYINIYKRSRGAGCRRRTPGSSPMGALPPPRGIPGGTFWPLRRESGAMKFGGSTLEGFRKGRSKPRMPVPRVVAEGLDFRLVFWLSFRCTVFDEKPGLFSIRQNPLNLQQVSRENVVFTPEGLSFGHQNSINLSCFSWNLSRSLFFRTSILLFYATRRICCTPSDLLHPERSDGRQNGTRNRPRGRQEHTIFTFRRVPLCDPTTVCCPSGHPKHPRLHF